MRLFSLLLLVLIVFNPIFAQTKIHGIVLDSTLEKPLNDVLIEVVGGKLTSYSDSYGSFNFVNLPNDTYQIRFSKPDYFTKTIQFIAADSVKEYFLNVSMNTISSVTDTIDVNGKYFKKDKSVNTSHINVFNEEIRKAPGAGEDVIRYFEGSPGVSVVSDVENVLVVRGGSPFENLTLIDGVEIKNPNHYGPPGSTNGLLSYINLRLVKEANFFSGGFPVIYGDKLSSVLDIEFKKGSMIRYSGNLNVSATGFGANFEGPINSKSSFMFSARRSYFELIKDLLQTEVIPAYWDFNLKIDHDFSKDRSLSLVSMLALDETKPYKKGEFENDTVHSKIFAIGLNYKISSQRLSYIATAGYNWTYYNLGYSPYFLNLNDRELSVLNRVIFKPQKDLSAEFFAGVKYLFPKYKIERHAYVNSYSYVAPAISFNSSFNTYKLNAGFNFTHTFAHDKFILNGGARIDVFGLINEKFYVSPRLGFTYKLSPTLNLNANAGFFCQAPEVLWVVSDVQNRNLTYMKLFQFVLGVEKFVSNDIKFSFEPFVKQYFNYPVSVYNPIFIFINSGFDVIPNYLDRAVSAGKGYSLGLDILFQKKNSARGMYWTFNSSFSHSRFKAIIGGQQPGGFDPDFQFTLTAGYKFSSGLSLSTRVRYEGPKPDTPLDTLTSSWTGTTVLNNTKYFTTRLPYYARIDLRVDYQMKFGKYGLTAYVDVLNVLNRENVTAYYWGNINNRIEKIPELPRVPFIGIDLQF